MLDMVIIGAAFLIIELCGLSTANNRLLMSVCLLVCLLLRELLCGPRFLYDSTLWALTLGQKGNVIKSVPGVILKLKDACMSHNV